MNINVYQELIKKFAVYPSANTKSLQEAMYLTLGLNGEAGEIAEKVKKWFRDGEINKVALAKELGDVYWYVSMLCSAFDVDASDVLDKNIDKLSRRKHEGKLHGSGDDR